MNCPHCASPSLTTARFCSSCGTRLAPTVSSTTIHPEPRILAEIAARTHNAVILTDAAGRIEWVNQAFVQMTGYTLDEIRGRTPGSFLQGTLSDAKICSKMRQAVREGREFHAEILNYHKSGRTFWVQIEGKPIHDEAGHLTHFMAIETDITEQFQAKLELERRVLERTLALENTVEEYEREIMERQRVEAALTTSEARLKEAHRIAGLGAWEFEFTTQQLWWSEEQYRLNGVEPDFPITQPFFLSLIHPEDQASFDAAFQVLLSEGIVTTDYRIIKPDGTACHMHGIASLIRNAAGQPLRMHGTNQDITERVQAKAALQAERDRLRQIIDSQFGFVAVLSLEGIIVEVNQTPLQLIGLSRDEVLGKRFWEVGWLDPGTEDLARAAIEIAASGGVVRGDIIARFAGVGRRDIDACFNPIFSAQGQVVNVIAFGVDITERKQAEAAVHHSEARYRRAERASNDGLWEWNCVTGEIYNSPRWLDMLGYQTGDIPNDLDAFRNLVHPEDMRDLESATKNLSKGNHRFDREIRVRQKDGHYFWVRCRGECEFNSDGTPLHLTVTNTDISARKQTEFALRKSESRLKESQRIAHLGNWELNLKTNVLHWCDEIFRIFELDPQQFKASYEAFLNVVHPDDRKLVDDAYTTSLRNRLPYRIVHRLLMPDGRIKYVEEQCETDFEPDGTPLCSRGTVQDITNRVRAEAALRESEERFSLAMEATLDGLWDWNIKTGSCYFSPQWLRLLGFAPEDIQKSIDFFFSIVHPEDVIDLEQALEEHFSGSSVRQIELRLKQKSGEYRWFLGRGKVVARDEVGQPTRMLGTITDITERKQIEQSLRLKQFSINRAVDPVFWIAPNAKILYVNDAACKTLGFSRKELLEKTVHDINPHFPAEAWPAHWEELKQRKSFSFETENCTKDGNLIQTEVTVNYILFEGREYNCAMMRDITQRKQAEQQSQELRDALAHANRLGMMGEMAAGLAHELNQPLTSLCLYANSALACDLSSGGEPLRNCLERINALALRTGEIVRHMRSFVSRGSSQRAMHDINGLIQDVLIILENEFKSSGVTLELDLEPSPPKIMADGIQIQQVLVNLIRNALEAFQNSQGKNCCVSIESRFTPDSLRVSISDTAGGIDPAVAASLFQPFQTTKPEGLGLGLAICRSLIENHGGNIQAGPNSEGGTTFCFTLPIILE